MMEREETSSTHAGHEAGVSLVLYRDTPVTYEAHGNRRKE